jgi:organic radical activating enzyme
MIIVSKDQAQSIHTDWDGEYGWGSFTLNDAESKMDYLATAIWMQLSTQGNDASALIICRELLGLPEWMPSASASIDHQSMFFLPASESGATVNLKFARAFADWIKSEGVVVLGGNDNGGTHPLANGTDAMPFERETNNPYVVKHDELSDTWTLFNRSTGAKLRLELNPGEALELVDISGKPAPRATLVPVEHWEEDLSEPKKMGSPELVDVKITDYCDIGCAYCYQGSTTEGKHAKMEDIKILARELFKAGVLEVAIGGGEPTRHPQFVEILELFNAHGIVANFTTRDLSFLKNEELSERIFAASKSIAVSVSSVAQIDQARVIYQDAVDNKYGVEGVSFQYVMGTASDVEFENMVKHSINANLNLTLLGYKDTGRGLAWREGAGKAFALRDAKVQAQSTSWIDLVKSSLSERAPWARVCIDTALARACESQMKDSKIPRHLWHKSEGLVSMYIDAVSMKMGKSSFESLDQMEPLGADWMTTFASWMPESKPAKAGVRRTT